MARMSSHDVRERLLEAGVRIFSKSGFNGCSVQDITDSAGVPKGSFYNHFDSKETLAAAALRLYWSDGACDRLAVLTRPGLTPLQRLRLYFEQGSAEIIEMDYTCGCLIGNMAAELSDHSPVISTELAAIYESWSRRVGACIREAQECGDISSGADPDMLATFALNAWEGALLRARIEKSARPLRQFIEMIFTSLLR
jgi:TetR/AcrR family transcriptional regulator, transcriptional repressor for nem operon